MEITKNHNETFKTYMTPWWTPSLGGVIAGARNESGKTRWLPCQVATSVTMMALGHPHSYRSSKQLPDSRWKELKGYAIHPHLDYCWRRDW